jgi:hypothetical protein
MVSPKVSLLEASVGPGRLEKETTGLSSPDDPEAYSIAVRAGRCLAPVPVASTAARAGVVVGLGAVTLSGSSR